MDVSEKARRRREKFQDLHLKIIDFTEKIVKINILDLKIPKISGAFGAKTTQIIRKKQRENPEKKSGILEFFPDFPSISEFRNPEENSGF